MVLGVVIAAELWWTYFAWVHARLEHAIDRVTGSVQSTMARDAFSFVHFVVGRRARCSCRSLARRSAQPGAPRPPLQTQQYKVLISQMLNCKMLSSLKLYL